VKKCIETGLDIEPMKLRLIRVELDNGETEILATSLTDGEIYPHAIFSDLYHLRWPAEEDYKTLKYRIEVENFSGKTKHSVYQDFYAKLFSKNFAAAVGNKIRKIFIQTTEAVRPNRKFP
jgi:hypothetical protein